MSAGPYPLLIILLMSVLSADRARKRDQAMKWRRDAVREERKMIGGVPVRRLPVQTGVSSRVDTSDGRNVRRCSPPPLRATQYLPLCPRWRRHRRRCNPYGRPSPAGYVATVEAARLPVLAEAVVERVARLSRARRGQGDGMPVIATSRRGSRFSCTAAAAAHRVHDDDDDDDDHDDQTCVVD